MYFAFPKGNAVKTIWSAQPLGRERIMIGCQYYTLLHRKNRESLLNFSENDVSRRRIQFSMMLNMM